MSDYLGIKLGRSEAIKFSEGNTFVKVDDNVRGKDIFFVQPIALAPNDEFVEILFWMDAFKRASVQSVTAIIPYFSYAKGDKKDEPRVSIRARVCAESIELAGADRVIMMDLHSPQIQGFFKKPVDHLHALPVLCEYIKSLQINNLVVVSPDSGFAKNARNYASALNTPLALGDKMRRSHDEQAEVLELIGDVNGKNALIVDDFSLSGGTIIAMAEMLKNKGAETIYVCLSHFLIGEERLHRLEDSSIEQLITTDSVDNPALYQSNKIKVVSVAPLFAEAIKRINADESVSTLFNKVPSSVIRGSLNK